MKTGSPAYPCPDSRTDPKNRIPGRRRRLGAEEMEISRAGDSNMADAWVGDRNERRFLLIILQIGVFPAKDSTLFISR